MALCLSAIDGHTVSLVLVQHRDEMNVIPHHVPSTTAQNHSKPSVNTRGDLDGDEGEGVVIGVVCIRGREAL